MYNTHDIRSERKRWNIKSVVQVTCRSNTIRSSPLTCTMPAVVWIQLILDAFRYGGHNVRLHQHTFIYSEKVDHLMTTI